MSEISKQTRLSQEEINRYSRHLILPEVGLKGQLKLKNSIKSLSRPIKKELARD